MAGNDIASPVAWSFTTAGGDTTPPEVIDITPPPNAIGVSLTAVVTATFSEPINPSTLSLLLRNPANMVVPATLFYDAGTRVARLTPTGGLAPSTTYTAFLAGIRDVAGNDQPTNLAWSFTTTGPPATIGLPTIGSFLDSGDSNYLNGSKVTTTAAGQVSSMSVYVGPIDSLVANRQYQLAIYRDNAGRPGTLVAVSATGTLVANEWNTLACVRVAARGHELLVDVQHERPDRGGQQHALQHRCRWAGRVQHRIRPFGTWPATFPASTLTNLVFSLFATLGTDTTPPTVIAMTPANGATGVSTVTDMMAAFSEPIDPATLKTSSFVLRDSAGVSVGADGRLRRGHPRRHADPLGAARRVDDLHRDDQHRREGRGGQRAGESVRLVVYDSRRSSIGVREAQSDERVGRGGHQTVSSLNVGGEHRGDQPRVLHRHGQQQRV